MSIKHEIACGVIPLRRFESALYTFLVHHKKGEYWGFPKGHKNPDEEPHETAERELFEECGLRIDSFLDFPSFSEGYIFKRDGVDIQKSVTYFVATVSGDTHFCADEILQGKWVPLKELLENVTFDETKNLCKELINIVKNF